MNCENRGSTFWLYRDSVYKFIKKCPGQSIFFLGLFLASAFIAGCEEKKVDQSKIENKPQTQNEPQDTVSRRQLMFDKSPNLELLPAELVPFVTNPYITYYFEEADMNQDGLNDYILVLVQSPMKGDNGEDNLNEPAPILIILRQKDKTLRYHSSNDKVFTLENLSSRVSEEAGIDADTLGNGFNIYFNTQGAGATASFTNDIYRFKFDANSNKFYLAELTEETGYVSPGAALGFMKNQQDDDMISEEEAYENEVRKVKFKVGEKWFSNFKFDKPE